VADCFKYPNKVGEAQVGDLSPETVQRLNTALRFHDDARRRVRGRGPILTRAIASRYAESAFTSSGEASTSIAPKASSPNRRSRSRAKPIPLPAAKPASPLSGRRPVHPPGRSPVHDLDSLRLLVATRAAAPRGCTCFRTSSFCNS